MQLQTVDILGFNFLNVTTSQFLNLLYTDISKHQNRFVITANPEIIMHARRHPSYAKIVHSADYLVPDGIGIIKASKLTDTPLSERVTGFDIFIALLKWANTNHSKIYLLGGKPDVLEKMFRKVQTTYPNINVVGRHDGYFKDETPILDEITQTKPEIVFVATGFPKQEEFIAKNRQVSNSLWIGIGGSFDVFAGVVKRAPLFWQKHNIEWLYRLITNPKRIKRQIVLPLFMFEAFKSQKKKKS